MGTTNRLQFPHLKNKEPQPATKQVQTETQETSAASRGERRDRATANKHNEITIALRIDCTPSTAFRAYISTTGMGLSSVGSC
jgi:hypothetical protein